MRVFWIGALAALGLGVLAHQPIGAQTVADGYQVNVQGGSVYTTSRGFRGLTLIGGDFSSVQGQARNRVAVLTPDGSVQPFFNPNIANGTVLDSLAHSSGEFVFVGSFTSPHSRMARYFFDGEQVPGFGAIIDATVRAVIEDPVSTQIYIGGDFSQVGSAARSRVARLNANGTADPSFVPVEFSGAVRALALQPDGKLIVAGNVMRVGDAGPRRMYRLNSDGSWDNSFFVSDLAAAGNDIRTIAVQADGRILVGGDFPGHLRRYEADGTRDLSYEPPSLSSTVYSIDLQPDGRVIVGGDFSGVGNGRPRLLRLYESGAVDTSFNPLPSPGSAVRSAQVQPDGGVLIGGDFTNYADAGRNRLARVNASGRIDRNLGLTQLDPANFERVRALAEGPDGSLYVGGTFSRFGGVNRTSLARVLSEGTVDPAFQPVVNAFVGAIYVQRDGRILIGGGFGQVNGESRGRVARLHPDGSLDTSFVNGLSGTNGRVLGMAVQSDGKIVVVGDILDPVTGNRGVLRLNPDGSRDSSFIFQHFDDYVKAVAIDDQGRIVLGGSFSTVGGFQRLGLARLLSSGFLDPSFVPSVQGGGSTVETLAIRNNRLLVGGRFQEINGMSCPRLAQLAMDGIVEQCNNDNIFRVFSLAVRADGRFYVGGYETSSNERSARLQLRDSVLSLASGFTEVSSPWDNAERNIRALSVLSDGRLAVSGTFASIGGQARGGVARIRVDDDIEQSLGWGVGSEQVLWNRGSLATRRIGSEPVEPPRVMVSQSCCNLASFVPAAGGGAMEKTNAENWRLDGFAGLPGKFYMMVEARVGNNQGSGTYTLRTPIHRFEGPPVPPVLADLSVKLSASNEEPSPGDQLMISVDVTNAGPSTATETGVQLDLPTGLTLTDFDVSQGDFDPESGFWRITTMEASGPSSEGVLRLEVVVNLEGSHEIAAEILADEFDPNYNNNSASLALDVQFARSDLQLSKSVTSQLALPGDEVTFGLVVVNAGPEVAHSVTVQNQMPSGYVWLGDEGAGAYNPTTGTWNIGSLAVGEDVLLRIYAEVTDSGEYTSVASAASLSLDPDPDNNLAIASIQPFTDVAVQISTDTPNPEPEVPISIEIEVFNHGPMAALEASAVIDWFGFVLTGHTVSQGQYDPSDGLWQLGTLGLDDDQGPAHATLVLHGHVSPSVPQVTIIANAGSATRDPDSSNNSDALEFQFPDGDRIFDDRFQSQPEPLIGQM